MRAIDRGRRGIALVEATIALALLATAGLAWMTLALQTSTSLDAALRREVLVRDAAAILGRYSRLDVASLEARAGRRFEGGLEVRVSMLSEGLFAVEIADRAANTVLLESAFFRPLTEVTDAP